MKHINADQKKTCLFITGDEFNKALDEIFDRRVRAEYTITWTKWISLSRSFSTKNKVKSKAPPLMGRK